MRHLWVLFAVAASPLVAQQDSTLRSAMRLVTEGQGDSARALVRVGAPLGAVDVRRREGIRVGDRA